MLVWKAQWANIVACPGQKSSKDNLACAQSLFERGDESVWRSSVSRSYYAAYCAAASKICVPGQAFRHGWNNPPHEDLPNMLSHATGLNGAAKRAACRGLRILREARIDADYRPGRTIDKRDAYVALKEAIRVLHHLELLQ